MMIGITMELTIITTILIFKKTSGQQQQQQKKDRKHFAPRILRFLNQELHSETT